MKPEAEEFESEGDTGNLVRFAWHIYITADRHLEQTVFIGYSKWVKGRQGAEAIVESHEHSTLNLMCDSIGCRA